MLYSVLILFFVGGLDTDSNFSSGYYDHGVHYYYENCYNSLTASQTSMMSCGTSLLDNTGFESNFTSWDDNGNSSITSDANTGSNALLISGGEGGRSQTISVNPGETYSLGFFAKKTGSEEAHASMVFKDVSGNKIVDTKRKVFENIYEHHILTMTVPVGAVSVEVIGYKRAGSGTAYFDDFCLELVNDICASSTELNSDGDNTCNKLDIDDDNDGIRDTDENICNFQFQTLAEWTHNTPINSAIGGNLYTSGLSSIGNEMYGSGISASRVSTILYIDGVDQPDFNSAITDNDYVEYSFTTDGSIPAVHLLRFRITKASSFPVPGNFGYDYGILVSDDGFATSTVISDLYTVDSNINPQLTTLKQEADDNFYFLKPATTYTFRCYFFNKTTDLTVSAIFDDFTIEAFVCDAPLDTDGDGHPNHLDLDSDNDGITDLAESGHDAIDSDNDGIIDLASTSSGINGLFDGVETSADRGNINYRISDSEPSPDRIYDPYELDSDGDGCYDVNEENLPDPDEDGVAGSGTPIVDSNGLIIGHTYGPTANDFWQDYNLSTCIDVTGRIFEDINYGGGDGRDYSESDNSAQSSGWSAGDINVSGAIVELYDNNGAFITSTTTDATGLYIFSDVGVGDFSIRVVTETVSSNKNSNSTNPTPLGVQTYRKSGTSAITNEVGGSEPEKKDAGPNTTNANLSTLYTNDITAYSVTEITLSGTDLMDIDFGYNFDTVVNENDSGQGSLRQFILNSNVLDNTNLDQEDTPTAGVDFPKPASTEHSIFMIPGNGVHTIEPITVLPSITDTYTHITGYTQEGSSQGTIAGRTNTIELSGISVLIDGLNINASNTTISGLIVNNFRSGIRGSTVRDSAFIWGNYIGSSPDGLTGEGNSSEGISLQRFTSSFIGTNGDDTNDENEGNLVVDNNQGIQIRNTEDVLIAGNVVGLDKNTAAPLGNRFNGIFIRDATGVNVVGYNDNSSGALASNFRNVSSGNGNDGLRVLNSDNQIISNNHFGTDISGIVALGNRNFGIQVQGSSSNNIIGTDSDGNADTVEGNLISGNGAGIRLQVNGTGSDNLIMGNYIGTDITGNASLGNISQGLDINTFTSTIIGTNGDGIRDEIERNIISGNTTDGIRISNADRTIVSGNHIGLGEDGITAVGNGSRGIFITVGTQDAIIGYDPSMAVSDPDIVGNKIHHNDDAAVAISSSTATKNRISRNSMFDNGAIGIDLDYDSVTTNDNGDGDSGSNNLLNFPVFDLLTLSEDSILTVVGFAPMGSAIEIFISDNGQNPNPLPSSYTNSFGEGHIFFFEGIEGSTDDADTTIGTYDNDGTGIIMTRTQSRFEFVFDIKGLGIDLGTLITATARDTDNNTSEFSNVVEVKTACCTIIMTNGYIRNIPQP